MRLGDAFQRDDNATETIGASAACGRSPLYLKLAAIQLTVASITLIRLSTMQVGILGLEYSTHLNRRKNRSDPLPPIHA